MNGNPFACDAKGNPHTWVEEYYGHRCAECGLFFADGSAPWDEPTATPQESSALNSSPAEQSSSRISGATPTTAPGQYEG